VSTPRAPAASNGFDLKHRSRALTEGPERAPARAYLKGIGFDDEALARPIVGVASTWIETMPCNFHLRALAAKVKEGIREAGATPMEFNTIAISDGITMGTSGMKTSLVSRYVHSLFSDQYLTTVGVKIEKKTVDLENDRVEREYRLFRPLDGRERRPAGC
jgi:dihydroxyacid dehydratase/phosphogluconate dehydratase